MHPPYPSNWKTNDNIVLLSVKLILKVSFDEVINVRKWHRKIFLTCFIHIFYYTLNVFYYDDIEN